MGFLIIERVPSGNGTKKNCDESVIVSLFRCVRARSAVRWIIVSTEFGIAIEVMFRGKILAHCYGCFVGKQSSGFRDMRSPVCFQIM